MRAAHLVLTLTSVISFTCTHAKIVLAFSSASGKAQGTGKLQTSMFRRYHSCVGWQQLLSSPKLI
ncbi:unnamed protein product [Plutella xylostella]|uniref:(diamondback moth) hypothetical protein n=1 Tax=Plutella xylostella TaxID=51655 RepID=A0A8S4G2K2_PLUXY|nr:unnamed protein product [Plutella xylostella]